MRRHFYNAYDADRFSLKLRWLIIALWAVAGYGNVDLLFLVAYLGASAFVGVIATRLCSNLEIYRKRGARFTQILRFVDGAGATAIASYFARTEQAGGDIQKLWITAIPVLLLEGVSSRSTKRVAVLAVTLGMINIYGSILSDGIKHAWVPLTVIAVSAVFGIVLAKFQHKERELSDRDRRLTTLMDTAGALAASGSLTALIQHTLESAVQDINASAGIVALIDEDDKTILRTEAAFSTEGEFGFPRELSIGQGITGYVVKMGQPISLSAKEGEFIECDNIAEDVRSAISVPLINREFSGTSSIGVENIIGAITIVNTGDRSTIENDDLDLLQSLSSLLANAIHNARLEERQRATFLRTLESLATALEARDDYTRGHSQRVCDLSLMIGQKMGLTNEALEELRIGTILHDIGKIGVPDAILNKPGRLTEEEFLQMKQHPVIGYEICRPLQLSEGILMIIRNHHEKLDGSGYPDGLKGGELPLSLRIVCVADAFDAMSSRRPYRNVMSMTYVMGELSKGAGVQFDSVVVEALKDLLYSHSLDELYAQHWDLEEGTGELAA